MELLLSNSICVLRSSISASFNDDWWIWYVNQPFDHLGKLSEENRRADLRFIFHPDRILTKLQTGSFDGVYINFE